MLTWVVPCKVNEDVREGTNVEVKSMSRYEGEYGGEGSWPLIEKKQKIYILGKADLQIW